MMDDKRLQEIKARAEAAASDLRRYLPPKQDMMDLIGAADGTPFGAGRYPVWIDPEPYAMEAGAKIIDDLLAEVRRLRTVEESLVVENTRLRAELEAARGDMRALSDEYKFCNMCKYHNGEGVDTCSHPLRFSCDAENFYEWRGATENGGVE